VNFKEKGLGSRRKEKGASLTTTHEVLRKEGLDGGLSNQSLLGTQGESNFKQQRRMMGRGGSKGRTRQKKGPGKICVCKKEGGKT